ncbi:MAG: hypothetical protein DWB59_00440 [Anaerolineae bacterium]|nr:hypothetical protein [Anaerolineae bacterium]
MPTERDLRFDEKVQAERNGVGIAEFAPEFKTRLHLVIAVLIIAQNAVHMPEVVDSVRGKPAFVRFARVDKTFCDHAFRFEIRAAQVLDGAAEDQRVGKDGAFVHCAKQGDGFIVESLRARELPRTEVEQTLLHERRAEDSIRQRVARFFF